MDAREAWIEQHAAELLAVLRDPQARAEVLALLGGDNYQAERRRRLAEAAQELAQHELRWERREGE
jgi:hypothetical protein